MEYRTHVPAAPLDRFVEHMWHCADTPVHSRERILPAGTVELVINLREDGIRIYHPTRADRYVAHSGAVVSGTYTTCFAIDPTVHASILGVHFRPGGAFPFMGIALAEIADAHVDLEDLWGRDAVELRERLSTTPSLGERFRLLEAALRKRLQAARVHHPATGVALDVLEPGMHTMHIRDVAATIGLSQRSLIDRFRTEVGVTPKLFHRLRRFHRARCWAARPDAPCWASLAADLGYFDQAHLIRDFRAFSGLSPAEYLRWRTDTTMPDHVPLASVG